MCLVPSPVTGLHGGVEEVLVQCRSDWCRFSTGICSQDDLNVPFWNVVLTLPLFPLLILLLSQAIWPQRNSPIEEGPGDTISLEAFFLDLLSH